MDKQVDLDQKNLSQPPSPPPNMLHVVFFGFEAVWHKHTILPISFTHWQRIHLALPGIDAHYLASSCTSSAPKYTKYILAQNMCLLSKFLSFYTWLRDKEDWVLIVYILWYRVFVVFLSYGLYEYILYTWIFKICFKFLRGLIGALRKI